MRRLGREDSLLAFALGAEDACLGLALRLDHGVERLGELVRRKDVGEVDRAEADAVPIVDALVSAGLAKTKSDAAKREEFIGFAVDLMTLAGVLEAFGGLLLLLGLFTRPVAFVLAGQMAVAYWMAHAPQNPFPANNGGDAAILYCFVFVYLVFAGPGALSLDERMGRRR